MKIKLNNKNIDIYEAIHFKDRLFGLMGRKNINYGLLFKRCNAIHTFFMREPIDVIVLDQTNKIVFIKNKLLPNKLFRIKSKQKNTSILELPQNTSTIFKLNEILFFK